MLEQAILTQEDQWSKLDCGQTISELGLAQHRIVKSAIKKIAEIKPILDTPNVSPTASISKKIEEIVNLSKPLDQGFHHIIANVEQACLEKKNREFYGRNSKNFFLYVRNSILPRFNGFDFAR